MLVGLGVVHPAAVEVALKRPSLPFVRVVLLNPRGDFSLNANPAQCGQALLQCIGKCGGHSENPRIPQAALPAVTAPGFNGPCSSLGCGQRCDPGGLPEPFLRV